MMANCEKCVKKDVCREYEPNSMKACGHYADEDGSHSKWEISCDGYYPYCRKCGKEPPGREMTDYCPSCGARMDGKER